MPLPVLKKVEIADRILPSLELTGDYRDVALLGPYRLQVVIADAVGKGIPASLIMMFLHGAIQAEVWHHNADLKAMARLSNSIRVKDTESYLKAMARLSNSILVRDTEADKFITCFFGIYNAKENTLRYINCGHNPPMLVRPTGEVERLEEGGPMLGVVSEASYEAGLVTLKSGDVVVMFTDGVTEAERADGEQYGPERLEALLKTHHHHAAEDLLDLIEQDVRTFTGNAEATFRDDFTMMVLKILDDPMPAPSYAIDKALRLYGQRRWML